MRSMVRLAGVMACASVVIAMAGCSGSKGNSGDLLRVTPAPSATGNVAYDNQRLQDCTPLPEPTGPADSNLRFDGPCPFTQTQAVLCVNRVDDYYAYVNRDLPQHGQLSALINVEKYKGPGTYTKNSVVFLQVSRAGVLYQWKQEEASLTVTDNGRRVIVGPSSLPALAGGPARGEVRVEGTIACRP
jgi:hypothetical protein